MKIGVACGGTGGHLFPGLSTAQVLRGRGHDVTLWLTGRGVEDASLAGWGDAVVRMRASGLRTGHPLRAAGAAIGLLAGVLPCRSVMRRNRPDVLLGMGGYACVGPVLAARTLGVPVVLHEANAVSGRAVSALSRFAAAVAVGFSEAKDGIRGPRVVHTGFPLRTDLDTRFEDGALQPDVFTVLAAGGSQGAHAVNMAVSEAVCCVHGEGMQIQVVHLTGTADEAAMRARYAAAGVHALVFGFLAEMGSAYNAADLAVCRAGAATCAELSVCGVPALLLPYPGSARDHQAKNAQCLVRAGAADCREQAALTVDWLAGYLRDCRAEPERLARMREAMLSLALGHGAQRLADVVEAEGRANRA